MARCEWVSRRSAQPPSATRALAIEAAEVQELFLWRLSVGFVRDRNPNFALLLCSSRISRMGLSGSFSGNHLSFSVARLTRNASNASGAHCLPYRPRLGAHRCFLVFSDPVSSTYDPSACLDMCNLSRGSVSVIGFQSFDCSKRVMSIPHAIS